MNKASLAARLGMTGVSYSFLSESRCKQTIEIFRTSDVYRCRRLEKEFNHIPALISEIVDLYGPQLSEICIFSPYGLDELSLLLSNTKCFFYSLRENPFLLSLDGFVVIDLDKQIAIIVDYYEADLQSPAKVILLGKFTDQSSANSAMSKS